MNFAEVRIPKGTYPTLSRSPTAGRYDGSGMETETNAVKRPVSMSLEYVCS